MGIILFMGAMAVASAVVVMSLGKINNDDTSIIYKKVKISDSMDYESALKLQDTIIDDIKDMKRNISVSDLRIRKGAYDKGKYDDSGRYTQHRLKQSNTANDDSITKLEKRLKDLEKIIKRK
ncbi:MAG: hypothetical protein KAI18_04180, partial [Candidatus Aenigmarchaeota archaeon]|nr:hypothetical protein [Candidatus Aenigmarchaeota archaeon]